MISIDWATQIISIPKSDLTLIQSFPTEIRELNLNNFRLTLKDIEDNVDGIVNLRTHNHNTEVSLGGIVYARIIEIINGYTITFEDGQYAVNLVGANSNVGDVVNVNQVSVRSANSAGLISNQAIEYSSFNGGVTVKKDSGITGTVFPKGTPQAPVDNIPDAVLIAQVRGFETIFIKGDFTFDTGDNITNYSIIGDNRSKSFFTFLSGSTTNGIQISKATVTGEFDNTADFNNCTLIDIKYTQGEINDCSLQGTITLANSGQTSIIDSNDGISESNVQPIIDFNGAGNSLAVRNYNGDLTLINKTGPEGVEMNLSTGGHIILDSTIINGNIRLTGIIEVTDESSSGATIDITQVIFPDQLQLASFNGYVYINPTLGSAGVKYPLGTSQYPVNNINDALTIMNNRGLETLLLDGTLYLTDIDLSKKVIIGVNNLDSVLVLVSGNITTKTIFKNMILVGALNGYVYVEASALQSLTNIGSSVFPSVFRDCIIRADSGGNPTLKLKATGNTENIHFINCSSGVPGQGTATLDINNSAASLAFRKYGGGITIKNITGGQDSTFEFDQGQIILDSSCTSGTTRLGGIYKLTNNSTLTVKERNQSITDNISISGATFSADTTAIAAAVWDKLTADHQTASTFGKALYDILVATGQIQHTGNLNTDLLVNKPNNPNP